MSSKHIDSAPFLDIPASLVEEMLSKTSQISDNLFKSLDLIKKKKNSFRTQLEEANILDSDRNYQDDTRLESIAVDGAYAIERLLGSDLIAIGAVCVEGLNSVNNSKSVTNFRNHEIFIDVEKHDPENMIAARGLMLEMEINLAAEAPYDLIFLDGSLTTPMIHMYKAIDFIANRNTVTSNTIKENYPDFLNSYKKILRSDEKIWVGLPKYTSRNDIGDKFKWPSDYDDRAILTLILNDGEFTNPTYFTNKENWHMKLPVLNNKEIRIESVMKDVISEISRLNVIYYKPNKWSPALRIELSNKIANDKKKLSLLLSNLKNQCSFPNIMEPYPLYLADRIVKHIAPAIPAYKQILTKNLAEIDKFKEDITDILFIMHSYRTESGM